MGGVLLPKRSGYDEKPQAAASEPAFDVAALAVGTFAAAVATTLAYSSGQAVDVLNDSSLLGISRFEKSYDNAISCYQEV